MSKTFTLRLFAVEVLPFSMIITHKHNRYIAFDLYGKPTATKNGSAAMLERRKTLAYTNSPLVVYTNLSPNHSGLRTHSIDRITPHCAVGQVTLEGLGEWFADPSTGASSNYCIDRDGRVGMFVEEKNRSWCSSSNANDQRAVTIECASDSAEPFKFRRVVYQKLIQLCVDICRRNGKKKLLWLGDETSTFNYCPAPDEMILTVHRWFSNKSCPGNWMYARMGDLAKQVTAALSKDLYSPVPSQITEVLYRMRKSLSKISQRIMR